MAEPASTEPKSTGDGDRDASGTAGAVRSERVTDHGLGPPAFFARRHSGDLLTRFIGDIQMVQLAVTDAVTTYLRDGHFLHESADEIARYAKGELKQVLAQVRTGLGERGENENDFARILEAVEKAREAMRKPDVQPELLVFARRRAGDFQAVLGTWTADYLDATAATLDRAAGRATLRT